MRKVFQIGDHVIWHCKDFEIDTYIYGYISKVESDHYIASTKGNECQAYDDLELWIDAGNEKDFQKVEDSGDKKMRKDNKLSASSQ